MQPFFFYELLSVQVCSFSFFTPAAFPLCYPDAISFTTLRNIFFQLLALFILFFFACILACFCLSYSILPITFTHLFFALPLLTVSLLFYLSVFLGVCVCTDNSLAGSVHRYSRPLRAPLFILSRFSSTTAQGEGWWRGLQLYV